MYNQTEEVNNLLTLMKLQNSNIHELNKLILTAFSDMVLINSHEFNEFVKHISEFIHYHYNSEGYSQAAQLVQTYHYILWERLLDSQVLAAAEQIELAIGYLEIVVRERQIRVNPQIMLLNHFILLMEETQLKIIETIEKLLKHSHPSPQLQN